MSGGGTCAAGTPGQIARSHVSPVFAYWHAVAWPRQGMPLDAFLTFSLAGSSFVLPRGPCSFSTWLWVRPEVGQEWNFVPHSPCRGAVESGDSSCSPLLVSFLLLSCLPPGNAPIFCILVDSLARGLVLGWLVWLGVFFRFGWRVFCSSLDCPPSCKPLTC